MLILFKGQNATQQQFYFAMMQSAISIHNNVVKDFQLHLLWVLLLELIFGTHGSEDAVRTGNLNLTIEEISLQWHVSSNRRFGWLSKFWFRAFVLPLSLV